MGKSKIVKRGGTLSSPEHPPRKAFAKGQEVRLVWIEAEPELPEPLGQHPHKTLGIVLSFEDGQRV
jgi:hypothetical protein